MTSVLYSLGMCMEDEVTIDEEVYVEQLDEEDVDDGDE